MSAGLSRRKLASYAAERLLAGEDAIIDQLAALLVDEGREREADLLVRDIEKCLAEKGQMVLTIETAHKLSDQARQQIEQLFADKSIYWREIVNPELIGGFRLQTPTQLLDRTIAGGLNKLRAQKI